ncbi:MAG: OmpA family protein [Planctomycetota bacterium]
MRNFRPHPTLLIGLALTFAFAGCGNQRELMYKEVEVGELETQISDLQGELATKDARIAELEAKPPVVIEEPRDDLSDELAAYGAEVTWRNGELIIAIDNQILFKSGSNDLSPTARRTLDKVSDVIKDRYAGHYVRVNGHTDNQPIVRTRNKWEDNWHLAGARARKVLHYLIEREGIPERYLGFAGYADQRPRATNDTNAGRARNRRVEIIVLPKRPQARG